jgi:sugar lactone lactonase YvrE
VRLSRPMATCAAAVLAAGLGGCAHAPPRPAPVEPVVWPEPPADPRVRLASVMSSPEDGAPRPSFWRRAWRAFVGLDAADDELARFQRPFGLAATADGGLLVADPDAVLVVRTRPGAPPAFLSCRDRPWSAPMAVAFSGDGDVYVADAGEGAVARIGADGRCAWLGEGILERPSGLALRGGEIFVADPPSHHVVVLSGAGEVLRTLGAHGDGDGGLNFPTSVALDASGNLLVVDALNFRIARFGPDGRWLGAFGATLGDGGPFAMPKSIATGADGRVYVSDAQRDVVVVFRPDGTFDYVFGAPGSAAGRFTHPAGLASSKDRVYVADSYARRIQAFEILGAHP